MNDALYKFVWRCAKCSSHFASINYVEGSIKQEKKCSKCKSLNTLVINEKEIKITCRLADVNETIELAIGTMPLQSLHK